jgi:hypothetical protein
MCVKHLRLLSKDGIHNQWWWFHGQWAKAHRRPCCTSWAPNDRSERCSRVRIVIKCTETRNKTAIQQCGDIQDERTLCVHWHSKRPPPPLHRSTATHPVVWKSSHHQAVSKQEDGRCRIRKSFIIIWLPATGVPKPSPSSNTRNAAKQRKESVCMPIHASRAPNGSNNTHLERAPNKRER